MRAPARAPAIRGILGCAACLLAAACGGEPSSSSRRCDGEGAEPHATGAFSCPTSDGCWRTLALDDAGAFALEAALDLSDTRASQIILDGVPRRRSALRIPLLCASEVIGLELSSATIETRIAEPGDGEPRLWTMRASEASVEDGELVVHVDGPVSDGSTLRLDAGFLHVTGAGDVESAASASGHWLLSGDVPSPRAAARWFKAFQPRDPDLFARSVYGGAADRDPEPPPTDPVELGERLSTHLARKVARGFLSEARANELRALFDRTLAGDAPGVAAVFTDADGALEPHLLLATLATAGTVLESAIDVVIGGENLSGMPFRVVWDGQYRVRLPAGATAAMYADTDGRLWLVVDPRLRDEPFHAVAPTIGHEALHQDRALGWEEEAVAKVAEAVAWGQMLLADPDAALLGTHETRFFNTELLWLLNSGRAGYPNPGFRAAPLAEDPPNAAPGSNRVDASYESAIRRLYSETAPRATPGNDHLTAVATRVHGAPTGPLDFSDQTLDRVFDDVRTFDPEQHFELLEILRLEPVTRPDEPE